MKRRTQPKGIEELWQKSEAEEKKNPIEVLDEWLTKLENNVNSLNKEYSKKINAIEFVSNGNATNIVESNKKIKEHDKKIEEHEKKIKEHDKKIEKHNKKIEEHDERIDSIEDNYVKISDTIENLDREIRKIHKFLLPQMYPNEIDAFKSKPRMPTDKEVKKNMQNLQKFNRNIARLTSQKNKRSQRSKTLSRRRTIKKARNQISRIKTLGGTRKKNNIDLMYNMGSCSSDNEAMSNFARVPLSGGRRRRRKSRRRKPRKTKKRRKRVKSRRRRTTRKRRRR